MASVGRTNGNVKRTNKKGTRELIPADVIVDGVASSHTIKKEKFKCELCNKLFSAKSTLKVHPCEPRRRLNQKDDKGVKIAHYAFKKIYNKPTATYDEFIKSKIYSSLVKVGQLLVQYRTTLSIEYIDFLIQQQIRLDYWTKESTFEKFVAEHTKSEDAFDAIERSLRSLESIAEEQNKELNEILTSFTEKDIRNMIVSGRVSPWLLYCCDSGINALSLLVQCESKDVMAIIDPEYWSNLFSKYHTDVANIRTILKDGGL